MGLGRPGARRVRWWAPVLGLVFRQVASAFQLLLPTTTRLVHLSTVAACQSDDDGGCSRVAWLRGLGSVMLTTSIAGTTIATTTTACPQSSQAAGIQGLSLRPPEGNCEGCLGVINGLLANCDRESNCVSSQDDRPGTFQEPWTYESSTGRAMTRLRGLVESLPGVEVVKEDGPYLRYEIVSGGGGGGARGGDVDDVEFYFTPSDYTVQFRASRRTSTNDKGANGKLMEKLRIALGFEKLPVLRNRQRAFFFMESPFDTFGPVYGEAVPSPEEMDRSEVFSDTDPKAPLWQGPSPYPRARD